MPGGINQRSSADCSIAASIYSSWGSGQKHLGNTEDWELPEHL